MTYIITIFEMQPNSSRSERLIKNIKSWVFPHNNYVFTVSLKDFFNLEREFLQQGIFEKF
jgi:hypothetical protein